MAVAQQIITLCDPCLMEGKEAPGQPWGLSIAVPGAKPLAFEIDVCDMHAQPYRVMLEHLAEDGRKAGKRPLPTVATSSTAAADAAPRVAADGCPVCGHVIASKSGMRTHLQNEHNTTMAEATGTAKIACVAGDCDRKFAGFQGLSSHLRTVHGWTLERARQGVAAAKAA